MNRYSVGNVPVVLHRSVPYGRCRLSDTATTALFWILQPEQPLFHTGPADKPAPFERRVLARLLNRIGQRAGVLPSNPHRFRHTFAIEFLRNGGNMFALQDILGHTNLEMVRRYLHIVQADRAHAHRIASPADNWRL